MKAIKSELKSLPLYVNIYIYIYIILSRKVIVMEITSNKSC